MSCDPLRTPRLSIHSWSWYFFESLGFKTKWCGSIRSDTTCCAWMRYDHDCSISNDTIYNNLVSPSDTIRVHDGMQTWYDHHDRGSRFGTMWHAHIRSDAFISNRYALLWQDTIVVQMSFTIPIIFTHGLSDDLTRRVYIQPDWLSTSFCLSRPTELTFQPIPLDNGRSSVLISSPERKCQAAARPATEPRELQSGSSGDIIDIFRTPLSLNYYEL